MTLRELCLAQTALTAEDIAVLESYEQTLPALSDLVGGDVFIDCMGREGIAFVAAQVSPKHIPSAYSKQVLGLAADRDNEPAVYGAFQDGMPFHDTVANTQLNRTVLQDVTPLCNGEKVIAVLIAEHDVTGQMRMEKKYRALSDTMLTASMRESDTANAGAVPAVGAEDAFTVRESNHRIKNDLQLLASVCGIKARSACGEPEKNAYRECASMVLSVAQLHTFFTDLNETNRLLDMRQLLNKLAESLRGSVLGYCGATLTVDSDSLLIRPDTAVSVVLCVNELILNALKYAFPTGEAGTVTVRVRTGNSFCTVLVADDGCGADTFREGTGLKLLSETVRVKLGGELNITSGPEGTKAAFTFPLM